MAQQKQPTPTSTIRINGDIARDEFVSLLLESTGEGIYGVDLSGNAIFVNPACASILGYTVDELMGEHMHLLVHHTRPDGTPYPVEECRIYRALSELEGTHVEDEVMFRKDGDSFPAEYWSYPMIRDGELVGSVVTFVDITERVHQQEQLRAAAERISLLLTSTGEGIYGVDVDGHCTFINPAAVEQLGYDSDQALLGKQMHELVHHTRPDGRPYPVAECRIYEALRDLQGTHVEDEIMFRADGSSYPAEYWSYPVVRDGVLMGSVVTFVDITERREVERRLQEAKARMEDELNIGREIQMSMLPVDFPVFPHRSEFDIHATLEAAREVGGDLYDFFLLDDDRLCFLVGDVSDKGVPAALFMAVTKTLIKSNAINDSSIASILTAVNQELCHHNDSSMFVTIFAAILDTRRGEMSYTNAGHNPPFIKRADGTVEKLKDRHGPVAGAVDGLAYRESSIDLGGGDVVVLYTDGVSEAMDETGEQFTEDALEALLAGHELTSPATAVELINDAVSGHRGEAEQSDDITILVLSFAGGAGAEDAAELDLTVPASVDGIATVLDAFGRFASERALPDQARQMVMLALDDLLNNIATYAYEDASGAVMEIQATLDSDRLVITIMDTGRPFNPFGVNSPDVTAPLDERDIGGLGIHLVRNVMDEVDYSRRAGRNVVTVTKRFDPEAKSADAITEGNGGT